MPRRSTGRAERGPRRTPVSTWRPKGPVTRGNRAGTGYPAAAFDPAVLHALMPVEVLATLRIRAKKKKDPGPEGPKHKEWNARYRASLGKKLKALGFTKDVIDQIESDYVEAAVKTFLGDKKAMAKFVLKWITMLWRVKGAIEQEYKEEGAAPKWNE